MGNTPSQEDPRRPQKLSKQRLDLHISDHYLLDSSLGSATAHGHGRCSNSYLVGSVPISPITTSPVDTEFPGIGIPILSGEREDPLTPTINRFSHQDLRRGSAMSRTWSFRSDRSQRRSSMLSSISRPNSSVINGDRPLARSESVHAVERRGSAHYVKTFEAQRLMALDQDMPGVSPSVTLQTSAPDRDITENTWKSSHPTQSATRPVNRPNPDISSYLPVRRRSIIQIPGVATRSDRSGQSSPQRSSFRSSLSSTPSETRNNSIESQPQQHDHLTVPSITYDSQPPERAVTPCEADYQQLGGMKFGSLRIVNGSPRPSPGLEPSFEEKEGSKSSHDTSTQSSSDKDTPCSTMGTSVSSEMDFADPAQKPLFKVSNPFETAMSKALETSQHDVSPLSENVDDREYSTSEFLDVRDDPNAKPTPERIRLELESKTLKSLSRSDSGFISSPSSVSSRKAPSKADSAYGSSVSLRSLRSFKSAVTDISRKSSLKQQQKAPESSGAEETEPVLRPAESSSRVTEIQRPTQQQPETSVSRIMKPEEKTPIKSAMHRPGRHSRMSSVGSNHSVEFQLPDQSPPLSPTQPQHQISARLKPHRLHPSRSALPAPVTMDDGRKQRPIGGSQRRGPPKVRHNRGGDKLSLSPMRSAGPSGAQGNTASPLVQYRPYLRDEKSKDTLRTIMSVGSTDMLQNMGRQSSNNIPELPIEIPEPSKTEEPIPPSRRRRSLRKSISQAASALFSSDKSSKAAKETEAASRKTETTTAETNVQRGSGSNVGNQAPMTPKAKYGELGSHPRTSSRVGMGSPASPQQTFGSPSSPSSGIKKTRSPPPVSMRTRSARLPRGHLPNPRSTPNTTSVPLRRRSVPHDFQRQQVHSYPPAQNPAALYGMSLAGVMSMDPQQVSTLQGYQAMPMQMVPVPNNQYQSFHDRQLAHSRMSLSQGQNVPGNATRPRSSSMSAATQSNHGQIRPQVQGFQGVNQGLQPLHHYMPQPHIYGIDPLSQQQLHQNMLLNTHQNQPQHRRVRSQGVMNDRNPPYRILHSYNSPAYRGVPIWG